VTHEHFRLDENPPAPWLLLVATPSDTCDWLWAIDTENKHKLRHAWFAAAKIHDTGTIL